jgi:hypothetical protein
MPRKSGAGGLVVLLIVLLIALGAFSYFAFFSDNPPWGKTTTGTTATTTSYPITTGPLVFVKSTDPTGNKAVIEMQWETSELYKSQVVYGKTDTYGSTTSLEADFTKAHVASFPNLDMSSTYHYRIILIDKNNKEWKSDDSRFNTPAPATTQ